MNSQSVNYTVVAVGIIGICSVAVWLITARKWFVGPLREIEEAQRLGVDITESRELETKENELGGSEKSGESKVATDVKPQEVNAEQ